ncbi:unnamed protein product [Pylaiella littoralis]
MSPENKTNCTKSKTKTSSQVCTFLYGYENPRRRHVLLLFLHRADRRLTVAQSSSSFILIWSPRLSAVKNSGRQPILLRLRPHHYRSYLTFPSPLRPHASGTIAGGGCTVYWGAGEAAGGAP